MELLNAIAEGKNLRWTNKRAGLMKCNKVNTNIVSWVNTFRDKRLTSPKGRRRRPDIFLHIDYNIIDHLSL